KPVTSSGYLSNHRRSLGKLSGVYVTPFNLSVGLVTYYQTGIPISRIGYSNAYSRYEFYLTRRGTEGRVPATYDTNVHPAYPLAPRPGSLTFLTDFFNILNTQRVLAVDQRYNTSEFDDPNQICPAGSDQNGCNATYGKAIARSLPFSVRFGAKLGF